MLLQQHNGIADENKRAENGSKAAVPAKGSCLLQQEPFLHHDAQMKMAYDGMAKITGQVSYLWRLWTSRIECIVEVSNVFV